MHFQCSLDALSVTRIDPLRCCRVDLGKLSGKGRQPLGSLPRRKVGADHRVGRRHVRDAFCQNAEIQHRAADENGHAASSAGISHGRKRVSTEVRRAVDLGRIAEPINAWVCALRPWTASRCPSISR